MEVLLMLEYSSVCYKNSFLTQVIVRVDFAQFIQTNIILAPSLKLFWNSRHSAMV